MIPDKIFKSLLHSYEGYMVYLKGESIELGYKPDYVLKRENDYILLESENTSSRKTFVGGLIKAAHFLQGQKSGTLIFVIVPKENTTAIQIANHLKTYYSWIKDKTNLNSVYVIEAGLYYDGNTAISINSKTFLDYAIKV